jgi:hypothetical protein
MDNSVVVFGKSLVRILVAARLSLQISRSFASSFYRLMPWQPTVVAFQIHLLIFPCHSTSQRTNTEAVTALLHNPTLIQPLQCGYVWKFSQLFLQYCRLRVTDILWNDSSRSDVQEIIFSVEH